MSEEFYTVERAAERLQLHPKTVLRFIKEGRMRATRIGKAYRILRSDLEAFGGVVDAGADRAEPARARVTSIIDLPEVSVALSQRLATALQASLIGQTARPDPVHMDTVYDPERRHLKIVIIAAPADAAALLQMLHALLEGLR